MQTRQDPRSLRVKGNAYNTQTNTVLTNVSLHMVLYILEGIENYGSFMCRRFATSSNRSKHRHTDHIISILRFSQLLTNRKSGKHEENLQQFSALGMDMGFFYLFSLAVTLPNSTSTFTQTFESISDVLRIGSIIIFHLSKLRKAKFFMLCDVIFLVRLQGKFDIDHSW